MSHINPSFPLVGDTNWGPSLLAGVANITDGVNGLDDRVAALEYTGTVATSVKSVQGRTGAVVITKADVGLSAVDNTADSAKPLSIAEQNALAGKAPVASPSFTGTTTVSNLTVTGAVSGITAATVGLSNSQLDLIIATLINTQGSQVRTAIQGMMSGTVTPNPTPTPTLANTIAPSISGTPTVGQVLTASNGSWSAAPDTATYQWIRSGSQTGTTVYGPISNATGQTYTLVAADGGNSVSVLVSVAKAGYNPSSASSAAVSVAALPVANTNYLITESGNVLTAETGDILIPETGTVVTPPPPSPPTASLSNISTSITAGQAITGSVALSNISTAYVGLFQSGTQVGSRLTQSNGALSGLTPTTAGTYTVRVYTASTGGTLLTESASITVATGAPPTTVTAFYVSPSGSDSNAGTIGAPFLTFEKAQTAMRGSSTKTTYLRGGTYARTAKFSMAAADNGTTWKAYPNETPIIDGSGTVTDVVWLDYHTANITFDHITFQNCIGCALHLNGYITGGDDGTITGVTVSNCTFRNIISNGSYGAGNGGAIRASFATKNNTFTHNLFQDMYCPGISMVAGGAQEIVQGNRITYNRFLRMNNAGQPDTGSIYMLDRGHNGDVNNPTIIDHNYVEDAGTDTETKLFYLDDETSCVQVTNNIFCGRSHWAFQLHGSDHITISNNIFDISDQKWPNDYYMGLYQDAVGAGFTNYGMTNNVFTKNIVFDSAGYATSSMWQFQDGTGGNLSAPAVSNNIYYWTNGTLPNAGVITDSSPKVLNPNFRSPSTRDYSFTSTTNASQISFTPIDQSVIGPQ